MARFDLTEFEWSVIQPLLPNKPRGVPRVDDRRVLNEIFWRGRTGAPWADIPSRYGPYTTCVNRFSRWRKAGVKYECIYLHAFSGGRDTRQGIGAWMTFYNHRRPHAAHGGETPVSVYRERLSAPGPGLRPTLHPTALVA